MLKLHPNCEFCDRDLPHDSMQANICTYECTFCSDCVENILMNVCPNCGGGFVPRPIRPKTERRPGSCIAKNPASTKRIYSDYSQDDIINFCQSVKDIPPEDR